MSRPDAEEPSPVVAMPVPTRPPQSGLTAADAEMFDQMAAVRREGAAYGGGPVYAAQCEAEAEGLEALAARLRDPAYHGLPVLRRGRGGEMAPPDHPDMRGRYRQVVQAVAATPGMLAADASLARLGLARDANVLTMAVEAAQDAGAETAAQKMLAHQLAAAHPLAMDLLASAATETQKHQVAAHLNSGALAEAARTTVAAARLMDSFARGALALDRLRNGGRQTVMVQHVTVGEGGQAVVAGSMAAGGGVGATPCLTRGGQAG